MNGLGLRGGWLELVAVLVGGGVVWRSGKGALREEVRVAAGPVGGIQRTLARKLRCLATVLECR